jgi:uncharacterized protein YgbK (DUF1537 family)
MSQRLAIITDDLTSATDCGIQVSRSGVDTLVLLGEYESSAGFRGFSAVSIDTDSRSLPPGEAYGRVREAAARMRADGFGAVYKSLDSTLRGNLGAEVDAVMDAYGFEMAVIAPAFPHYGRTTADGRHYLRGVPITRTEFARDPKTPVSENDLVRLFQSQSRRRAGLVRLDTLRGGSSAVSRRIDSLVSGGVELLVFDAQEEEDLDRVVLTVSESYQGVLWVGSTGLARCVPLALNFKTEKESRRRPRRSGGRGMVVSGSTSEVTEAQIGFLGAQPGVSTTVLSPLEVIHGGERAREEKERCLSRLREALEAGHDVALHVPPSRDEVAVVRSRGEELGLGEERAPGMISAALAEVTERVIESHEIAGLVLTGGDTAKTICARLGGVGIELLEEIEPGIPLGKLVGPVELQVVTKAGGFGTREVLYNALRRLRGE